MAGSVRCNRASSVARPPFKADDGAVVGLDLKSHVVKRVRDDNRAMWCRDGKLLERPLLHYITLALSRLELQLRFTGTTVGKQRPDGDASVAQELERVEYERHRLA